MSNKMNYFKHPRYMEIEQAIRTLLAWKYCKAHDNDGKCPKNEDEYCENFCWSVSEMEKAIDIVISVIGG